MKTGIIGAGAWGTALAITSHSAGCEVTLWSRDPILTFEMNTTHKNTKYLGNIKLPEAIIATSTLSDIINCDVLLLVIPAQKLREICTELKKLELNKNVPLVICCKGIEQKTHKLMSEVAAEILPNPVAILSGPNFASEVARLLPACATLACENSELGMKLVQNLGSKLFRIYYSPDVAGAQVGGAVKNVLAIACGIAIGRGLGENARAAIVTRGMAEIGRLCAAKGGKAETLMGLSGLGDIMLTCGSRSSRNMSFGYALGEGKPATDILEDNEMVTEGVATAQSVTELANSLGVDMPICQAVNDIIYNKADIEVAVKELLRRPLTIEGNS